MSKVGATGQGNDFINKKNQKTVSTRDWTKIGRGQDTDSQLNSGGEIVFVQTGQMFLEQVRNMGSIGRYGDSSDIFGQKF